MIKHKEVILPIEWEEYDELESSEYTFYNATFTEDFGNIKAGDTFKCVYVNYQKGILETYTPDENGLDIINRIKFKCVPVENE